MPNQEDLKHEILKRVGVTHRTHTVSYITGSWQEPTLIGKATVEVGREWSNKLYFDMAKEEVAARNKRIEESKKLQPHCSTCRCGKR